MDLARRAGAAGVIGVIPLFVDRPVEPVELRTRFDLLDVRHPLFGLVPGIGTKKVLIAAVCHKSSTGRHSFTGHSP
ncbi:hypothetical protein D3C80_1996940 [compost metagenome]